MATVTLPVTTNQHVKMQQVSVRQKNGKTKRWTLDVGFQIALVLHSYGNRHLKWCTPFCSQLEQWSVLLLPSRTQALIILLWRPPQ